jgi:hypothetical protein
MKKIIDDLLAMQRLDYIPDSMGYEVLDKAIALLTQLHDEQAVSETITVGRFIENRQTMSGTITVGSPDIHWEKHL